MLHVRTKQATYVNDRWIGPGEVIDIPDHLFSPEVHAVEPNIVPVDEVIEALDDPPPIEPLNQGDSDAS